MLDSHNWQILYFAKLFWIRLFAAPSDLWSIFHLEFCKLGSLSRYANAPSKDQSRWVFNIS